MSQKLLVMGLYSTLCTVYKPGTHGFIQYIPMHVLRFTIHGILQSIFSSLKTVGTIFCEHPLLLYYLYPLCPQKHPQFPLGESSMPQSKKGQQKKVATLEKTTVLCRSTFFISLQYG